MRRRGLAIGRALIADAPLIYDLAVERVQPTPSSPSASALAAASPPLGSARKLDGLILVTPFDSLKAVAQSMFPWLPIGPLFEHEIDAASAIEKLEDAGRDRRRRT